MFVFQKQRVLAAILSLDFIKAVAPFRDWWVGKGKAGFCGF